MKRILFLCFALLISGCAQQARDICCTKDFASGDAETATVFGTWNMWDAQSLAAAHCEKYSRSAKFNQQKTGPWNLAGFYPKGKVFDCVSKD